MFLMITYYLGSQAPGTSEFIPLKRHVSATSSSGTPIAAAPPRGQASTAQTAVAAVHPFIKPVEQVRAAYVLLHYTFSLSDNRRHDPKLKAHSLAAFIMHIVIA